MTTKVFAYGSISEGMVHFGKFAALIESKRIGWIKGAAYKLKVGYPVVLKDGCDNIPGQIFELRSSEILQALFDEYFGYNPMQPDKSLYIREEVVVRTESSDLSETAGVYFLNPLKLPSTATYIQGGNWLRSMQEAPLLTEMLTERQKTYVLKLGAASGRDIVPINDLGLYRELMSLELIVDKGRRLALSKLGQEVYRYLE